MAFWCWTTSNFNEFSLCSSVNLTTSIIGIDASVDSDYIFYASVNIISNDIINSCFADTNRFRTLLLCILLTMGFVKS